MSGSLKYFDSLRGVRVVTIRLRASGHTWAARPACELHVNVLVHALLEGFLGELAHSRCSQ